MARPLRARPMRTVCSWCEGVLVDVPEDERGVSHGICDACDQEFEVAAPGVRGRVLRCFLSCVPPSVTHHAKKRVTRLMRGGRRVPSLADNPELVRAKHELDWLLKPFRPAAPLVGAVWFDVVFVWPWLSRHTAKVRAGVRVPHVSKPDLDNLVKVLADRMAAARFFECDQRIVSLRARKFWGPRPGIWITVGEVAP